MLQIFMAVVAVVLLWVTVGGIVAKKGRRDGLRYQALAVVAFLVGGGLGVGAALVLADPNKVDFALVVLTQFLLPLVTGGAAAGAVVWRATQLRPSAAVEERAKNAADFDPFEGGAK